MPAIGAMGVLNKKVKKTGTMPHYGVTTREEADRNIYRHPLLDQAKWPVFVYDPVAKVAAVWEVADSESEAQATAYRCAEELPDVQLIL